MNFHLKTILAVLVELYGRLETEPITVIGYNVCPFCYTIPPVTYMIIFIVEYALLYYLVTQNPLQ